MKELMYLFLWNIAINLNHKYVHDYVHAKNKDKYMILATWKVNYVAERV